MRFSILLALSAAFVLSAATQASAVSSIDMIYLGPNEGETDQSACPGEDRGCVIAEAGATVRFIVVMTVDTLGMSAYGFDIEWDADLEDELDLDFFRQRSNLSIVTAPGPPPEAAGYNVSTELVIQDSTSEQTGSIEGFDAIPTSPSPPYAASVSFRLAYITYVVTENVNGNAGADIIPAFLRGPAFNTFGTAGFQPITPDFGGATVQVPEPGTTMLIVSSLSALVLLGLRSKRND